MTVENQLGGFVVGLVRAVGLSAEGGRAGGGEGRRILGTLRR